MITVYAGPMFSGKTQALMARLQSKQRAHKNVLVVQPALDNRYDSVDEIVVKQKTAQRFEKHASMAAYPIKNAAQLAALIREINPDVIGVDEAQFFGEEFSVALAAMAKDFDVYVAGLELDAERLDLVVHHARADGQQLRRVLLHPVRHLERFDERGTLDVLERNPRRRDLDHRGRLVASAAGVRRLAEAQVQADDRAS